MVNQFENLRSSRYEAFLATQGIKLLNSPISEHGLLENSNSLCACDVACMHRITSVVEATTRVLQLAMADMSGIVRMSATHKNGTTFRRQQPTNRSRGNDKDKAPRNEPPQRAIDIVIIISRTTLLIN